MGTEIYAIIFEQVKCEFHFFFTSRLIRPWKSLSEKGKNFQKLSPLIFERLDLWYFLWIIIDDITIFSRIGWDCSLTCVKCNLWHSLCGWNWPCGTCCKAILSTHIKLHSRIKGHIKLPLKYNCADIQLLFMVSEFRRFRKKKLFLFCFLSQNTF